MESTNLHVLRVIINIKYQLIGYLRIQQCVFRLFMFMLFLERNMKFNRKLCIHTLKIVLMLGLSIRYNVFVLFFKFKK